MKKELSRKIKILKQECETSASFEEISLKLEAAKMLENALWAINRVEQKLDGIPSHYRDHETTA